MSDVLYAPVARGAGNPLFELSSALSRRAREMRKRRSLKRLLDHEDFVLDDMGVARVDIHWVLSLPISVDASTELSRLSQQRRKQRF